MVSAATVFLERSPIVKVPFRIWRFVRVPRRTYSAVSECRFNFLALTEWLPTSLPESEPSLTSLPVINVIEVAVAVPASENTRARVAATVA